MAEYQDDIRFDQLTELKLGHHFDSLNAARCFFRHCRQLHTLTIFSNLITAVHFQGGLQMELPKLKQLKAEGCIFLLPTCFSFGARECIEFMVRGFSVDDFEYVADKLKSVLWADIHAKERKTFG